MYWLPNSKPYYGNWHGYQKERKNQESVREAYRLLSNHIVKHNPKIALILSQLINHKYYYIYEGMEQNLTVKQIMKKHKITESQYFRFQKEFFLLFYSLWEMREDNNIETR